MTSGSVLCMTPATSIGRFQPFFICLLYDVQYLHLLEIYVRDGRNALGNSKSEGLFGFRVNVDISL